MTASPTRPAHSWLTLALAWFAVGAPLLWGVAQTVRKALPLFS
ncbi:MAG TPA: hypothetical protein VNW92_23760 [Polyangiaceae bacterium]|jgi:hypothetical protein|nr:hypothetical protein [Polyangiaceae bacterium]